LFWPVTAFWFMTCDSLSTTPPCVAQQQARQLTWAHTSRCIFTSLIHLWEMAEYPSRPASNLDCIPFVACRGSKCWGAELRDGIDMQHPQSGMKTTCTGMGSPAMACATPSFQWACVPSASYEHSSMPEIHQRSTQT
jgi:hypothetical protein